MTQEDWEAQLDKSPDDWDLRLVYADWLEEEGLQDLAGAQRWLAREQKHPRGANVIWWHPYPNLEPNQSFRIPDALMELLPDKFDIPEARALFMIYHTQLGREGSAPAIRRYKTQALAVKALSIALKRLKEKK